MGKCNAILIIGAVLSLLGLGWWITERGNSNETDYTQEIERLKEQNDSLLVSNQQLDQEIERLQAISDSLKQDVQQKRIAIKELKKVKHEKIKAIDNYSSDKLYRFFAEFETDSTTTQR